MTLITQYAIENQKEFLTVINLHAINFVSAKIFSEEMDHIAQVVESLNILNHPLLLAGDFNTWSNERLVILNKLKNKLSLTEAIFMPDYRLTFRGLPLDHVFYSTHLSLISAKADRFYQGSDHRPLELVFDLKHSR
jgi:endonuclease/exonuclease/phosphatase (EEP) superfamily protein YafD